MCSPRRSPFSTASKVARKRGSSGVEEAQVEQLEQAGVELVAAEGRGEALLVRRARPAPRSPRGSSSARSRQKRRAVGEARAPRRCWRAGRRPPSTSPSCRCGRAVRVRNSHRPASGWSCIVPGALADPLERGEILRASPCGTAAGRRRPGRWKGRSGRRRRAGPGCRRRCRPAPAPCRDSRRAPSASPSSSLGSPDTP